MVGTTCTKLLVLCVLFLCLGSLNCTSLGYKTHRIAREDCGFRCKKDTSQCIDEDSVCDGKVDCKDGTDETSEVCQSIRCPGFLFKCAYGACINSDFECDGKKDCVDNSDETTKKCIAAISEQKCARGQFRCKNGECISEDNKCDGTVQCADGSDETKETCLDINCPGYTFKCTYGACVSGFARCNGISECLDGSDEDVKMCGGKVTTSSTTSTTASPFTDSTPPIVVAEGSCAIPQIANGKVNIDGSKYNFKPGDKINSGSLSTVECQKGYKLDTGNPLMICLNGVWSPSVPKCRQLCYPKISSTTSTYVNCTLNRQPIDCAEATEGTRATFKCAPFYEDFTIFKNPTHFCQDGTWDTVPSCTPVCGEKSVKAQTLIIGGKKVKRGNYPWQASLYRQKNGKYSHICGGSMVNLRLVITAAHCVTDNEGGVKPKGDYRVAVGKYYRTYDNPEDKSFTQFADIEEIIVPPEYQGSVQDYEADFAILVTKTPFQYAEFVQPVCIDWNYNNFYDSDLLGINGIVSGWGYTVRGDHPSEELKELSVPYVENSRCRKEISYDYQKYIKRDKMCAGYINQGIGVCEGDSGGGLVFENLLIKRFYLRGIVSISPQLEDSCDNNQYAIYTRVSSYLDLLSDTERKYRS